MEKKSETVLITGASSGIGLELAKCFAADKSNLILVARSTNALAELAAQLRLQHKIEVHVLTADLSLPETPKKIFDELSAQKISVDVLVNNAGFGLHGAFAKLSLPRQMEILQVNIMALTELTGLFLPHMIKQQTGGILNVGSVAGFMPGPYMAIYFATKAFVLSFTEALAAELSESGIKISALCPGATETNFSNVARGGQRRKIKNPGMSARNVAEYGYEKFRAGKIVVVPGLQNKILSRAPRALPRNLVRRILKFYNSTDA